MQYVSHEHIIEKRKEEYYLALRASQETFRTQTAPVGEVETIAPWLNFFLSVVKVQATEALALVDTDAHVDTLSPKQDDVLTYFASVSEASPRDISMATGILLPTIRKALNRLIKLGKVKRVGRGRATRYIKL
jgi:predicted HTH transcriptional regulator